MMPNERGEQIARRAVSIVRANLGFDQAEMAGALAGKVQDRLDRQRQHRAHDEFAALGPEQRAGFWMGVEQAAVDQRGQVLAACGGDFKASLDRIG